MSVGLEALSRAGAGPERPVYVLLPPPVQDFHSLATYLSQNASATFLDTISDFHLLLFLVTNEVMPLQVGSERAASRGRCAGGGRCALRGDSLRVPPPPALREAGGEAGGTGAVHRRPRTDPPFLRRTASACCWRPCGPATRSWPRPGKSRSSGPPSSSSAVSAPLLIPGHPLGSGTSAPSSLGPSGTGRRRLQQGSGSGCEVCAGDRLSLLGVHWDADGR